jgi:hypothetical protein
MIAIQWRGRFRHQDIQVGKLGKQRWPYVCFFFKIKQLRVVCNVVEEQEVRFGNCRRRRGFAASLSKPGLRLLQRKRLLHLKRARKKVRGTPTQLHRIFKPGKASLVLLHTRKIKIKLNNKKEKQSTNQTWPVWINMSA